VLIGAGASVWMSRFVGALLYGLEPRDPVTLVSSAAVLATVGALAGWLPAYRASRIDPAEVLREVSRGRASCRSTLRDGVRVCVVLSTTVEREDWWSLADDRNPAEQPALPRDGHR
jgi:hypothetical protein